jgi:nucleolin
MVSTDAPTKDTLTKLYIGNLGWDTSNEDLQECFSKFGETSECYVVFDRNTGESRGFGFVTYANEAEARDAVASMDGVELDGRRIKVAISKPKPFAESADSGDACKVYVGNLGYDTTADRIEEIFASCGTVSDVNLLIDRESGNSRGFAFVTFASPQDAQAAVDNLNGTNIDGRDIRVNVSRPRGEKSSFSENTFGGRGGGNKYGGGGGDIDSAKLFVGNLGWDTSTEDLQRVFSEYGRVVDARVVTDRDTGNSRGFGFITFDDAKSAENAIGSLDGMELGGREIRVSVSTPKKPRFQESYDEEW